MFSNYINIYCLNVLKLQGLQSEIIFIIFDIFFIYYYYGSDQVELRFNIVEKIVFEVKKGLLCVIFFDFALTHHQYQNYYYNLFIVHNIITPFNLVSILNLTKNKKKTVITTVSFQFYKLSIDKTSISISVLLS